MTTVPWVKVSEERYRVGYRWMLRRRFLLPHGQEMEVSVKDGPGGVVVLALTPDDKVVLAEQFRPGPEMVLREMPGGMMEEGEDAVEAGARELLEETGYVAESVKLVARVFFNAEYSQPTGVIVALGCRKVSEPHTDENEFTEPVEVSIEEFKRMARANEFTDWGGWPTVS